LNIKNFKLDNKSIKIYKVGGCVRNVLLKKYLNISMPLTDQDFVVIGATPEDMISAGFIPIAKNFPVFLHPLTKAEYALARTEKSTGIGHTMFTCNIKNISLEEDLLRRDITINAIAQSSDGGIIDPYNGVKDIKNKIIRHVSNAFIEDPLRILRVARFATILNFQIAPETLDLMKEMATKKMLASLPSERIYAEIVSTSKYNNFLVFISVLNKTDNLQFVFPSLAQNFTNISPYLNYIKNYQNTLENLSIIMIIDILSQQNLQSKPILAYFPFLKQKKIITKLQILKNFFELLNNPICLIQKDFNNLVYLAEKINNNINRDLIEIINKTNDHLPFKQKEKSIRLLLTLQNIYKKLRKYCFKNLTNNDIIQIKYKVAEQNYCDFYLTVK
jgi:tRNA nucleotidyltransferase/poly(A) polymerase